MRQVWNGATNESRLKNESGPGMESGLHVNQRRKMSLILEPSPINESGPNMSQGQTIKYESGPDNESGPNMSQVRISRPPYKGGGRRGVDRYRRGGRGNFGNRGRGRWTPRQNSQQISSSGSGNVAPETTKSVEEVADASVINIDQAGQVEIPYQSSVQPNVTSAPQRHMQVARCELCRMDCNSFEILEQHKGGKKHKKNMQKLEVLKAYQPVSNVRSNGQNVDSNSQGKLDPENMQNTEGNKQTILDIITF
ncbi:hypothetical protein POM88_021498 [Heracleum sosnowskyi]|uniref:U1-type domain-containing protein n=1 Tax=Heracleum sosnowskyi TaxID=360622 RepID=A0AAD8MTV6_9APIA|nr:hypothetical protein POM88_021498 [Heracleum sosnowskyi]